MRRRTFIAGLGSATAWPLVAQGQQTRVWRIAYLSTSSAADAHSVAVFNAFRAQLRDLGYIEGQNLRLEVRRAEGEGSITTLP
jgi:putative ABC transport system substrate-binding protein